MFEHWEYLLNLPKNLADVAQAILKAKQNAHDTRQAVGDLLGEIADCVSAIGNDIQEGRLSPERCGELDVYIQALDHMVVDTVGQQNADRMMRWLKYVAVVPGFVKVEIARDIATVVKPERSLSDRFKQSQDVLRVGGMIRAFANILAIPA